MIMECAGGGELYKWVEEKGRVSEAESRKIIFQVINAIHYCHIRGIVHRDLKLENVLFKAAGEMQVKVVDFGIAGVCEANKKDKVDAGSIAYMPPEVSRTRPFTIILFVLLSLSSQGARPRQPLMSGLSALCSMPCFTEDSHSGVTRKMSRSKKLQTRL